MPLQRFDNRRLTPLPPDGVVTRTCARSAALVRACQLGAGPATRPLWQPWESPRIEWPYGVFHVDSVDVARRAGLQLDGSWQLVDATTALARLRVRLAAQRADWSWWRPLAPQDAWDAGVVKDLSGLQGFRPRRATLLIVEHSAIDDAGLRVLAQLEQESWGWARAVRLVVAGGLPPAFARPVPA